jgi:HD-like signal output (HDOD) protein
MFYKGNLSNFYPPDLLVFLASSEQDGYLTVQSPDPLSITIQDGMVVDAFSPKGDNLLLRILFLKKRITAPQIQIIAKARKETSLSCRQVLEQLDFFPISSITAELMQSIEEVIFQFFQKDFGLFQFTDTTIDTNNCITKLYPDDLLLDITGRVDSWNEYLHSFGDLNQLVKLNPACKESPASRTEEIIVHLAQKGKTILQLINQAPFSDYVAAKAVVGCIRQQILTLQPNLHQPQGSTAVVSVFSQYKKGLRKTLQADNLRHKLEEVLHFCKNYFEYTAIISINKGMLERAICFTRNDNGTLSSERVTRDNLTIANDPIISTVCSKGLSYFGKMQKSDFFREIFPECPEGECGLLPFEIKGDQIKLLFAHTCSSPKGQTPMQYLELLSWLISPEQISEELPDDFGQDKIRKIMTLTDELPPMPHVAGKALEILNNPDNSLEKLSEVLEQDPSLLAMIIKVSNSALYSTGQEITNLHTAVAKLGLTIIRSLVLTAATHTLFPADNPKIQELSTPLWRHVKGCGLAARIIAKSINYSDPEEAFVGGLLHDIGKLAILLNYPDEYEQIENEALKTATPSYLMEKELLGFNHTDIGQMLTEKWHMPKALQTCVHFHHTPTEASDSFRQLTMIIHLANVLSHTAIHPQMQGFDLDDCCAHLQISEEQLAAITSEIQKSLKHIDSLDG